MRYSYVLRLTGAALVAAAVLVSGEWRVRAAGTITGVVFEDFNGNGARDTATTVASSGSGTTRLAVDRGMAGIVVTAYDGAGAAQGTATTGAGGAYSLAAAGTGPYRVEFTNLPAGYRPSAVAGGATGNGTTVQFVPDGNSSNVNLAVLDAANYCQNNPSVVTSCFVYGAATGAFGANPAVVSFPYAAGANSATAANYNQPTTHSLMVPVSAVGAVYGMAYVPGTSTVYAGAFMKKHSGFGSGGPGAIYAVDPFTGTTTLFADLDAIFGAGTAGVDPHNAADYNVDNGNASWDAVGKIALGSVEVSPDGATVFAMNLADRSVYALPTTGPLTTVTVRRAQIPLDAPGATGPGGADLRPFALQWFRGRLYVGLVNSAETTGATTADLRAYVYTLDPVTLAFSAAPVFQFPLNYPRGNVQAFNGTGPGAWSRWRTTFGTQSPSGVGTYPQPMLSGLSFDLDGNLTIGLRDRAGDQFGFFAQDNPSSGVLWEGVAGGDTLFAAITTPGDLDSGWTLESNASAGTFGPTAGANNNEGPGTAGNFGEYFYADAFGATHRELSGGAPVQLPGHPDVMTSAFDPGLTVRTGGFMWFDKTTGAKSKGYNLYDTGFSTPPQPTFSKANGFGEFVAICQAAPIEVGNRVWDDVDGDGVQDPGEPALDGVTVQLVAPGGAVIGTAVTANGGQYYFSSGAGTTTGNAIYNIAGLTPLTNGYTIRIAIGQVALGGRALTLANSDASGNGDSRDSDGVPAGANAEVVFNTGPAGANTHTFDVGFTNAVLTLSLGNLVWYDTNNNGMLDGGEQPVPNVDVALYRDNGDGLFNATTDTAAGTQATSGAGLYLFTGLTPGTYFVQVPASEFQAGQPLNGYQNSSGQTAGDTNSVDHGAPAPVPGQGIVSDAVTLTSGGEPVNDGDLDANSNLTIDFGFYRLALGNLVFIDADNSGTFNAGDTPRDGVPVNLFTGNGATLLATTVTAGGGLYEFTGLTPGDYMVGLTASAVTGYTSSTGGGTEPGPDPDNDVDNDDNGTNAGAVISALAVTLTPGAEPAVTNAIGETRNPTVDFGLIAVPGLSLGNYVWIDTNNDGVVSPGETGLDGVTVRLLDPTGTVVLGTQVTAGGGFYLFTGLTAGDYIVEVATPAGYVSSSGGGTEPASDPDNNVNDDDNGTASGAVVRSQPVTLTLGGEPTNDGDNDANSNLTVDFGFVPSGVLSLGNLVWLDLNNNGVVDPGEPAVPGVTLRLIAADGVTVLGATTTDGSGHYVFSGLLPGTYLVEVDRSGPLTGYRSSTDIVSSGDPNNDLDNDDNGVAVTATSVRSGPVVLTTLGEPVNDGDADPNSNLSIDFGFVRAVSLGNLVWADTNNNGRVDPGETGIAGVTVRLIAADGVTVLATAITDATGHYLFGGLLPGSYYVEVVPPPGSQSSTDIGSSPNPDNDTDNDDNGVNLNGGVVRSGLVTLTLGGEPINDGDTNDDSNLTVDFGFVPAGGGGSSADICLLQTVPASVTPGGQMTLTYTAVNRGPGLASGVMIEGMIPVGTTFVSATPSAGGVCTVTSGLLDCVWPGLTGSGPAGDRTVTIVLQVDPSLPGGTTIWSWFMAGSNSPEPYPENNMADGYVFVDAGAVTPVDLVITGTVQADAQSGGAVASVIGRPATVRFTVSNTGTAPARGQYALLLDDGGALSIAGVTLSQGWAAATGATSGVWDTGPVAPGTSATLDIIVAAANGTAARLQAVRVTGSPVDPNAANDSAEVAVDGIGAGSERFVAAGNLDGVAGGEIVTGGGAGETPQVQIFAGSGAAQRGFYAFDRTFRGGVRVAVCDVNGDGVDELIAAQGPGGGRVRVLSLASGVVTELVAFDAFEPGFTGGVNVACADLEGDGRADVVVGPAGGRAPDVKVFTVGALSAVVTAQFQAYEPAFTGGVRVSAARFAGSGLVGAFNVATMPGPGRAIELRVWQVSGAAATAVAAAPFFGATTGAGVLLGDLDGDSGLDVLMTPDGGRPALLQAYALTTGALLLNVPPNGSTGLHLAIGTLTGGPGRPELVVGSGPGMLPTVGTFVITAAGTGYQRLGFTALEQP